LIPTFHEYNDILSYGNRYVTILHLCRFSRGSAMILLLQESSGIFWHQIEEKILHDDILAQIKVQ